MGRTLATANQIILTEQSQFSDFRRALRKPDQDSLDELFVYARKHVAAITMAAHALPFETILLAMLLEEHTQNQRLWRAVELLQQELERRIEEPPGD
jgi:hypothetical protein